MSHVNRTALPATIAAAGTTSDAVDILGYDIIALAFDAAWDVAAATASFQTSHDGVTFLPVVDETGAAVSITATASEWAILKQQHIHGFGRFVKVVSSAAQTDETTVLVIGATQ